MFGSLSPSTASGKVLFIRDIGEWNSITVPATLDHLLGMGIGPLLLTRVGGLVAAVFIFTVLVGALVLVPFLVIGAWRRRRDAAFGPYFGYAFLLFAFSALVSAVHVPGGTFIHSAVALAPPATCSRSRGSSSASAWLASRRPAGTDPGRARVRRRGHDLRDRGRGRGHRARPQELGREARAHAGRRRGARRRRSPAHGPGHVDRCRRVPLLDRPPGVVLVNDPLDTVEQVARAYDIRWLVLEPNDTVAAAKADPRRRPTTGLGRPADPRAR